MIIPIQNLYLLLCYAWNHLEEADTRAVGIEEASTLANLFGRVLATGVERALRQGLDRGYLPESEETGQPRGRIDFSGSIRLGSLARNRLFCDVDDLSFDVLHNRIVKTTLRNLAQTDSLDGRLRDELRRIYRRMNGVTETELSPRIFKRIQLGSNSRAYDFLLRVCEIAFHSHLIDPESGRTIFRNFVQDEVKMRLLFQKFVQNYLKHHLDSQFSVRAASFEWQGLTGQANDLSLFPRLNTDVVVESDEKCVVIDTKYTQQPFALRYGEKKLRSEHLYQLFTYVKNYSVRYDRRDVEGMLIYPEAGEPFDFRYSVMGHGFRIVSLDLNQHWSRVGADLLGLIRPSMPFLSAPVCETVCT